MPYKPRLHVRINNSPFTGTRENITAEEVVKICDGKGAHGVFVTATSGQAYASAPLMCRISVR